MKYQLKIVALLSFSIAVFFVLYQFLLQIIPSVMFFGLERDFHIVPIQVSLLTSSFFYTYILAQIPAGICIDFFGVRRVLTSTILLAGVATLFFSMTHQLHAAYFFRIITGLVCAPAVVGAFAVASQQFDKRWFGLLVGITEMAGMLGAAIGDLLLSYLAGVMGWRNALSWVGVFGILLFVLTVMCLRNPTVRLPVVVKARDQFSNLWCLLKRPQIWLNGLYAGLMFIVVSALAGLWQIPFFSAIHPVNLMLASGSSASIFFGAAVGAPLLGWWVEKYKCYKKLMIVCPVLCSVLLLLVFYKPLLPVVTIFTALFLAGFFSAAYVLPFVLVRSLVSVESTGAALGFINMMCLLIGAPIMQPLIGALLHAWGHVTVSSTGVPVYSLASYQAVLWVLPLGTFLAALLVCMIKISRSD